MPLGQVCFGPVRGVELRSFHALRVFPECLAWLWLGANRQVLEWMSAVKPEVGWRQKRFSKVNGEKVGEGFK